MKLFVPFSEAVIERHGFSFGELVAFNAEYACWHSYDTDVVQPDRSHRPHVIRDAPLSEGGAADLR